jgi:hypothetical protein
MNTRLLALSLATLLAIPAYSAVAATDQSSLLPAAMTQEEASGGYLGVLLGPVPDSLRAQLGDLLPSGQGVMIRDVVTDSPAARAGLKSFDVVVGYNDQKLYSADQFSHLVWAERPDTTATLNVVHNGVAEQLKVKIGKAEEAGETGYPELAMQMNHHHRGPQWMYPGSDERNWESFDSLSLKKLDDGNFKADIQFLGQDGKLEKKEFKGTRDSIRDQILSQKDLPSPERYQLLEALSARDYYMPPSVWFAPEFYSP